MELLTVISVALADGLWQVGKKLLESASDSALKPAKEKLESGLLKKYRAAEKDGKLLGAIKSALEQVEAPTGDEDKLARWLRNVGLDKLQAEKNSALRQTLARAVIGFVDSSAQPPADLMTALAWPRSRADELAKLLAAFRAAFAGLDGWKDLIAYADSAHQNGKLSGILNVLARMGNAFVQSEAGSVLRVAVVETGLTPEQAAHIEEKYREGIQNEYQVHLVQGLAGQKAVSLPLEEIYLELGFLPFSGEQEREKELLKELEMDAAERMEREKERLQQRVTNVLAEAGKLAILGQPGSGKTISLKFIAYMLARGAAGAARLGLDMPYIPIFVRLADYAAELKQQPGLALESFLLDYIDRNFPGAKSQPDFLRAALDHGACMILLDGLDEVGDFGDTLIHGNTLRMETLKKVQSFASRRCNQKYANRMVVSSRIEGYRSGDLPDFHEMELSPLQIPDEAKAFLLRWFTAWLQETARLDLETARRRAERDYINDLMYSINESESVSRLAMNPLLLTILALIYQNERKRLPNRRVEVYEIVARTMIENWRYVQTGHVSKVQELIKAKDIYFMLASLAYWLRKSKEGGTAPAGEWEDKIYELLRDAGREEAELKTLIEHFMRHARQETGLLTERSHGQIGFFHLTLEEYMAAVEIGRKDTDKRLDMLEEHWQNPRWKEVVLLTAGYLDMNGNDEQLERFLLALLHLEGQSPGRGVWLAGRALADIGERSVKKSVLNDIRGKLKYVMQDADFETGLPHPEARFPVDMRASAADTLDELGYIPEDLYEFAEFSNADLSRLYFAKHPVANLQYKRFLDAPDFADEKYWTDFPKYDENGALMNETWGDEGLKWLQKALKSDSDHTDGKVIFPRYWRDPRFGIARRTVPVVGVTWYEANAYCKWLTANWQAQPEAAHLSSFLLSAAAASFSFRLPVEPEWLLAAGGLGEPIVVGKNKDGKDITRHRFPWDEAGRVTPEPKSNDDDVMKDILRRANIAQSGIGRTTPAGMYPLGRVNHLWDMAGNVWEWQANYRDQKNGWLSLRGGSWGDSQGSARVSGRDYDHPYDEWDSYGFRVVFAPPSALL